MIVIENDFFIIFVDSILLDRICFAMYIIIKKLIDCVFVCIKLFSLRFEHIESEYCYSGMFVKSMILIKYSLQYLYRIQIG